MDEQKDKNCRDIDKKSIGSDVYLTSSHGQALSI